MSRQKNYHVGKIGAFFNVFVAVVKKKPELLDDIPMLKATISQAIPGIRDREKCPNCDASMIEYTFNFDAWNALLLLNMAQTVEHRIEKGMEFTIANQVRVPELPVSHAVKCRTTQASKLGLVAQLKGRNGKRVAGTWVVTRRGWEALRGEAVPSKVRVWRGRIEERFSETITVMEALQSHVKYVKHTIAKGRKPKQDSRDDVLSYNPSHWVEFSRHEGKLFG